MHLNLAWRKARESPQGVCTCRGVQERREDRSTFDVSLSISDLLGRKRTELNVSNTVGPAGT